MRVQVGKGARWGLLRRVVLVIVVVSAVLPFSATATAETQDEASEFIPAVAATAVSGATDDWWATVQATIQKDLGIEGSEGLSTIPDWTVAGQAEGDEFGYEVAGAGDVNGDGYGDVIVGAYGFESLRGKAYVFYGSAAGLSMTWDWSATGEIVGDNFGNSVAGAGDVNGDGYDEVIVGAPMFDDGTTDNAGKAYVFHGGPGGLSTDPDWERVGYAENETFGASVAGAGDNNGDGYADVLVGAPHYGGGGGAVYLYRGSASGLSANDWFEGRGEQLSSGLGFSVAGAGDLDGDGYDDVIAGAPSWDDGGTLGVGRVYVYYGPLSGPYVGPQWDFIGEEGGDSLGASVAAAGDVNGDGYGDVIIGAYGAGDSSYQGKAYVFHGSGAGLASTPAWQPMGEGGYDYYGRSVAGVGDVNSDGYADVVVSATGYLGGQGRSYAYHGGPSGLGGWFWIYTGGYADYYFGRSVAAAGDVNGDGYADLIVGANGYGNHRGHAHVFHGAADPPSPTRDWYETGEDAWSSFGLSVASAGDVNGDGYSDVIVGAEGYPNGDDRGKAYLYQGAADGLGHFPAWAVAGDADGDQFGCAVASAGDVNGDGYGDVIVGVCGAGNGMAYVYLGSETGLGSDWAWVAYGEIGGGSDFGRAVASAGDVNGDGYGDIIVADPWYYDGQHSSIGKAYVWHGGPSGLELVRSWVATGVDAFDYYGRSVASAGDVNGDGYGDVIVGAYGYDHPSHNNAGAAYVYHGSASGLSTTANWSSSGSGYVGDGNEFGWSVAAAGDVNADGYSDIIAGAPGYGSYRGLAMVYLGTASGLAPIQVWAMLGGSAGDVLGSSVASAGDPNGDGYADVIFGVRGAGYAYVAAGGPSGPATASFMWYASGESSIDDFGSSVAGAGDVNGDGYADLLVGAPDYGASNEGRTYVYHGNWDGGRKVMARQLRGDYSWVPVQPWGLTHSGGFELWIWAIDPMGRGRVKVEVEACPPGAAFGEGACTVAYSSGWADAWDSGQARRISVNVTGLNANTLYRWRARVLHAPYSVDQPGITPPPNPAHGPWRRYLGQWVEADLRTTEGAAPEWQVFLPMVIK